MRAERADSAPGRADMVSFTHLAAWVKVIAIRSRAFGPGIQGGLLGRMEPNIFKYIWHHSKREQIAILLSAGS